MACIIGSESYLFLTAESTWGDFPGASGSGGSATYFMAPVQSYGVRVQRLMRQANVYTGLHQRKHSQVYGANVSGQIVTPLYGYIPSTLTDSLAEVFLEWAFADRELEEPRSYAAEWAEGPNVANRRHTGLRVNQATLSASAESGEISLALDVIGQQEYTLTTAQSLPNDMEKLADMQATDITLVLDGVTVKPSAVQWQLNRNLQPLRLNDFWISMLCGAVRDETVQFTIPKENAGWDVRQRLQGVTQNTEVTATLTMQGLHNGTGGGGTNYTKATVVFNRLSFVNQDVTGDFGILMQPLSFNVLKPDSASQGTTITWSEV